MQETYAPVAVINALKRLGWVIPAVEQDAHELLNVILTTLDEESHKIGRKVLMIQTFVYLVSIGIWNYTSLKSLANPIFV